MWSTALLCSFLSSLRNIFGSLHGTHFSSSLSKCPVAVSVMQQNLAKHSNFLAFSISRIQGIVLLSPSLRIFMLQVLMWLKDGHSSNSNCSASNFFHSVGRSGESVESHARIRVMISCMSSNCYPSHAADGTSGRRTDKPVFACCGRHLLRAQRTAKSNPVFSLTSHGNTTIPKRHEAICRERASVERSRDGVRISRGGNALDSRVVHAVRPRIRGPNEETARLARPEGVPRREAEASSTW